MEFRVLRYFLAIAREGNITRAAEFLNVTQPTLSRQIKDLEEELGQQLFVRGSHNIVLTTEGMMLRKRAEEIMDMVEKTKAEFGSFQKNIAGDVYIIFTAATPKTLPNVWTKACWISESLFSRPI